MVSRRLSSDRVSVDAELKEKDSRLGRKREVLIIGELASPIRSELIRRGAVLTVVDRLFQAFEALAAKRYDVVVIDPDLDGRGRDLVAAVKEGDVEHQLTLATLYGVRGAADFLKGIAPPQQHVLEEVRRLHRTTPFIVLSTPERWTYLIVIVSPDASFVEDAGKIPLASTIMTIDASRRLSSARPMA